MADQFSRQRQLVGSTADWAANNIVLGDGEIAVERAAGGVIKFKIGNGTATFSAAPYLTAGSTLTTQQLAVITALTNGTALPGPVVLPASVPTANDQAAHKKYVDDSVALAVKKAGDTMTGPLVLPTGAPTGQQAVSRVEGDKLYLSQTNMVTSGGTATQAGKVPVLGPDGKIDTSMLKLPAVLTLKGTIAPTATQPATPAAGDLWILNAAGTLDASWGLGSITVGAGDMLVRETSTAWSVIPTTTDLSAKVSKTGDTMTGPLTLSGDPTTALGAATKQYADHFKQAGTGAVDRTQTDKMREWVTPGDFGAVGDGTTPDNAALALTKTAATGRLINGAGKTYAITANLPTGWRMVDGKIVDSRTVNYTDRYSVVGIGEKALAANTFIPEQHPSSYPAPFTNWASGNHLVAIGGDALSANTTGRRNTAVGSRCMPLSTTAYYNTAVGSHSMEKLTIGHENVAIGVQALNSVTSGNGNTGLGMTAGTNVTTGNNNSFGGYLSGTTCTTGNGNTGFGYRAAFSVTTADDTVAFGRDALVSCTTGPDNTAVGANCAISVTTGGNNVAMGWSALRLADTSNNTAVGASTLYYATGANNTAFGCFAGNKLTTGNNNNFLGRNAGLEMLTGSGNTIIGSFNGTKDFDMSALNNRVIISNGEGTVYTYYDNGGRGHVNTFTAGAGIGFNARWSVNGGSEDASVFRVDSYGSACINAWSTATANNNLLINFVTEGVYTARGSITYNRTGGLVAYNTTSDYRAKDIIGPVQNPGATIDALKVYEGRMKGATQSRPMLVAHEAQAVAPYCVTGEKDAVDDDGEPVYQQMDVASLVPLLLAEVQSLRARIAALEAKP